MMLPDHDATPDEINAYNARVFEEKYESLRFKVWCVIWFGLGSLVGVFLMKIWSLP